MRAEAKQEAARALVAQRRALHEGVRRAAAVAQDPHEASFAQRAPVMRSLKRGGWWMRFVLRRPFAG